MKIAEGFYSSHLANCVFNAFFSCSAIVLNIVTIHAIRKTASLSKSLKILLLSLSVSDLAVGLMAEPLHVAILAMQVTQNTENNSSYDRTNIAYRITTNFFAPASSFLVTALITDRFLSIHSYLRYRQLVTDQRVIAVVMSIWMLSAVLSVIRMFLCAATVYGIYALVTFACVITVIFLSCKTYLVARGQINQIHALELTGQQASQNGELVNVARLRKFATSAVFVSVAFLVCYLPNMCILWTFAITSKPLHCYYNVSQFVSQSFDLLLEDETHSTSCHEHLTKRLFTS